MQLALMPPRSRASKLSTFWMALACAATSCTMTLSLTLLCVAGRRADAQQSRDVHLSVNAVVIAAAARVDRADVTTLSFRTTGEGEREVHVLIRARSAGESTVSIAARADGVTVDIVSPAGEATPVASSGVRVARTAPGTALSLPVTLRLRSSNAELLRQAVQAPVSLRVDSAAR
jgi:hypothetical protein